MERIRYPENNIAAREQLFADIESAAPKSRAANVRTLRNFAASWLPHRPEKPLRGSGYERYYVPDDLITAVGYLPAAHICQLAKRSKSGHYSTTAYISAEAAEIIKLIAANAW